MLGQELFIRLVAQLHDAEPFQPNQASIIEAEFSISLGTD